MERGKCNRCGMCCRAIVVAQPEEDWLCNPTRDGSDAAFMFENWTPIHRDTAFKINPNLPAWAKDKRAEVLFFSCLRYDEDTKSCTVQGEKPQVCSEYPWYGGKPRPDEGFYSSDCGYRIDALRMKLVEIVESMAVKKFGRDEYNEARYPGCKLFVKKADKEVSCAV